MYYSTVGQRVNGGVWIVAPRTAAYGRQSLDGSV